MIVTRQGGYIIGEIFGILRLQDRYAPSTEEWEYIAECFAKSDTPITFERLEGHLLMYRRNDHESH